jgi:hypothetical protein
MNLLNLRKDVRDLISINEKIQSALLHGDRLSDDEANLIRHCASELLETVPLPHTENWHTNVNGKEATRVSSRDREGH